MAAPARSRAELVADQARNPPYGTRTFADGDGPVRVGITGHGEALLLLAWSESDLARERAAGARVFGRLGITARMRVANALPGALATPGALVVGDVNEELGALDVPLGEVATEAAAAAAWELLDRVEVNVLVLDPARSACLLAGAPAQPRPWFQGIVWLCRPGEYATPPKVPHLPGWRRRWLAVPEVSSFVGSECAQRLLHIDAAFAPSVELGELVLGALHPGVPWRYRSAWPARAIGACSCGAPEPALQP
ncbi:MAG TPA: hypothetical protein VNO26_09085 [Candidatus Limnocylindria bacterium]|nr:hypothetical protein [Candidatus Limnocylindria bacterium]